MDANDLPRKNFVANIGNYESPCGYCRLGTNSSLGMVANQMTCEAYQDLLNRGWRRSGTWLYRSLAEQSECSCVPHTIRLDVHKFEPSRAQKQVMRRFEKYLAGAPVKTNLDLPPAPSTPPLSDDVPGWEVATSPAPDVRASLEPEGVCKKQQQDSCSTEERKRKSHLISASPPASPAVPAAVQGDVAAPCSAQVDSVADRMSRAISHAVRRMTEEGTLPEACYYSPDVKEVSSKQRRLLGPQALLTTAAAFPIAAAARRAAGPGSPSAEHLAALLAVRLEGAAGLQLSVQAKRGHLNFMMQPGALCDVRSGDDSAAVGGEEATCSMSTDSRDCGIQRPLLCPGPVQMGEAAADGQSEHSVGRQAGSDAPAGQHAGGAREHSSRGSSQTAEDAPEHASSASRMTKGATVSAQWGGVSRREIHVDAGYGYAAAAHTADAARLRGSDTGSSGCPDSCAGPEPLSAATQTRSRRFEVRLVPMPASRAEIAAEYPLYRRYQTIHHHESPQEVKESSFRRFLVDSPLMRRRAPLGPDGQVPYWSFGSYHQQYWIDGELVAVAVLDVLPQCISSVYFFWEPSLSFLSLGKVSALREIAFVQAAAMTCPSLHCYYMGYFISSCPKMRYKADFKPSDLLCMHSLCWVPVERAVPALDADMHCIISRIPGALEGLDATFMGDCSEACDYLSDAALDATLLYLSSQQGQRRLIRLGQLARTSVPQEALCLLKEKLRSWRKYVGPAADQYIHVM